MRIERLAAAIGRIMMYEYTNQIAAARCARGSRRRSTAAALLLPQVQPQEVHPTATIRLPRLESFPQDRLSRSARTPYRSLRPPRRSGLTDRPPLHDSTKGQPPFVASAGGQAPVPYHRPALSPTATAAPTGGTGQIGRASCRERV